MALYSLFAVSAPRTFLPMGRLALPPFTATYNTRY